MAEILTGLALANPAAVLFAWALSALLATFGVVQLEIETSTGSVLDRADPAWLFYQESQADFGGDEILVIALESETEFDRDVIGYILELTENLENIPGVRRVDSVSTVPLVQSRPDGFLSLEAAFANGIPDSANELANIGSHLQRDRLAPGSLISKDSKAFSVILLLEQGAETQYEEILAEVNRLLDGKSAWVSGVPIFRSEANAKTRRELSLFIPLTVAVIGILLAVLFRSVAAVAIPLAISGCASWITLGIMGALGVPITISTVILPSVLLALGCAYTMHFLVAASDPRDLGARSAEILDVASLVALSGLTTAIGFVAMSLVRIEAIRDIGTFGGLGVLLVLAATLTAAPAAIQVWPVPARSLDISQFIRCRGVPFILSVVGKYRWMMIGGSVLITAVVGVGVSEIKIETDVIVWFSKDHPIRTAYRAIRDRFSGISPINLVIEAPPGESITDPRVIRSLAELTRFLERMPEVGKAISVADPIAQMHEGFLGVQGAPLPIRRDLIEQYLLLLETKPQIGDLITSDRRRANVLMRINDNGSASLLHVAAQAESWWSTSGAGDYSARATGIMYEFARAEDEIAWGQIRGLAFALTAVSVILLAVLRSVRLALISLIPNAVPIAVAFGLMGFLGITLDAGTILVGNLALGIAVDDTLHIASRYHQRVRLGDEPVQALRLALQRVLAPVAYTTLVIALGFAVLGLSGFTFTRHLGILTSGILVLCLVADLILLPALLLSWGLSDERRRVRTRRPDSETESLAGAKAGNTT